MSDLPEPSIKTPIFQTCRLMAMWETSEQYTEHVERALALVQSKTFRTDSADTEVERIDCIPHINDILHALAATHHEFDAADVEHSKWTEFAKNQQGLIEHWRIPKEVTERSLLADKAFFGAQETLADHLQAEVVLIVQDALALLGISDWETVSEIARCAIKGGVPKIAIPKVEGSGAVTAASDQTSGFTCPHCHNGTSPDRLRCGICRRELYSGVGLDIGDGEREAA